MTEPRDEPPLDAPPEGAQCNEHPDAAAIIVCPRCGSYACLSCWHDPIRRCHACLMRDPAAAGDPVAWEDDRRNVAARFFSTLASALSPWRSAPGFARGGIAPALSFAAISFIPLALASHIIPFTATILFEPLFAFRLIGTPSDAEVAMDVGRAALLGLFTTAGQALVLGTAYASLVRAYQHKGHPVAAARVVLYRIWLLPLTLLLGSMLEALVTTDRAVLDNLLWVSVIPFFLLVTAMTTTARMGGGVGRVMSYVVVVIPVVAMMLTQAFLARALAPLLPDTEAITAAVRAAGATP